jgi:hypothetical protein
VQVGNFGYPIHRASKPREPGPPPTCPFIYYHNVKEPTDKKPDTEGSPIFLPEESVSCHVGDQTAEACASRPVKGPLERVFDSVNRLFAILLQKSVGVPESLRFARVAWDERLK